MSKKHEEMVEADHPISRIAHGLSENSLELAGQAGISQWDLCIAYANAIAQILAASKDMPRDSAFERFSDLIPVMQKSYDLAKHGSLGQ